MVSETSKDKHGKNKKVKVKVALEQGHEGPKEV